MRRKFISALLFGALVAASTSTFVSCKDYDDDINGLQGQITANASTLEELVTEKVNNLTTEINALKQEDARLNSALEAAKADLAAAIEEAKTAAGNAEAAAKAYADEKAAAAQVAAIEAAKQAVADAQALLQAGIDDANAQIAAISGKVTTQEEQIAGLLEADAALQTALETANANIAAAQGTADEALAAAQAAQGTADQNAATLAQVVENLTKVKAELDEQISILGDKVDQAVADIAANKADADAKLAQVNSLIESNTKAIEALQAKDTELAGLIAENTADLLELADQLTQVQAACTANLTAAKAYADAQVAALRSALGEDINKVSSDLAAALVRVSAAEEAISGIQEALKGQETVNEGVSQSIKDMQEDIAALQQSVVDNIDAVMLEIGEISGEIEKINGTMKTNSDAIKVLQETAAGLQKLLEEQQSSIDEAKQSISGLTQKVEDYISSNDQALEDLKTTLNDNFTAAIENQGKTLREEIEQKASELSTTLTQAITDGDAALQKKIDALQTQIGALSGDQSVVELIDDKIQKANDRIDEVKTYISDLETKIQGQLADVNGRIDDVLDELHGANKALMNYINAVEGQLGRMYDVLSKQLKGLVFNPEMYYQGIEAIGIKSFNYRAIVSGVEDANVDKNQINDGVSTRLASEETSVVPVVSASYWLNPSNASIDTATANVKDHFKFIVNNATYTRAASEEDIRVDSVRYDKEKNGLVNVFFSMKNANNIAKIPVHGDGKVDVAALSYTGKGTNGKDTTVMSDFAALKQYTITKFVINKAANANADVDEGHAHLAVSAKAAIEKDADGSYKYPTLEIAYDNLEGINLDEWFNVHYDLNNQPDKIWGDQEEIGKKKFKLVYELIGYQADDADKTNESKHATISDDNVLTVHDLNGTQGGRNIIGRTPLVRVKLIDENSNGNLVAVGYIIVKIVDVAVADITVEAEPITNGYTLNCEDNKALNNQRAITWLEVENLVLGHDKVNMSKEEFEKVYKLDNTDGTVNQYVLNSNGKYEIDNTPFGVITQSTDPDGHETNVLYWTVSNNEAYQYFVQQKNESKSVYVLFTSNIEQSGNPDIYVKLTWTPSSVSASPVATILNTKDHKSVADWHEANSRAAGWDELHLQVGDATVQGATCDYEQLVVSRTFNKNPLAILKAGLNNGYADLAADASISYEFDKTKLAGLESKFSGYDFTIDDRTDDQVLRASIGGGFAQAVATIIKADGKISIVENENTKVLINKYGAGQLADALTLPVVIKPSTCEPASDLVKFENNAFDVRVIKPIFITGSTVGEMQLNNASTLTQDVALSFEDFNEYDPLKFYENSMSKVTFWDFYGVESIELGGTIQTDYRGTGFKPVDPAVFTVDFIEPTGEISLKNMGKIKLTQVSMSRANDFQISVPLVVKYKWGELKHEVVVKVKAASGQNRAKSY